MSAAENTGLFKMHIIIWVFSNIYFLSKLFLTDTNAKTCEDKRLGFLKIHNLKLRPHLSTLPLVAQNFLPFNPSMALANDISSSSPLNFSYFFSSNNCIGLPKCNASRGRNFNGIFGELARSVHLASKKDASNWCLCRNSSWWWEPLSSDG